MLKTAVIFAGYGYYDTTFYPLGGSFQRATVDLPVTVTRDFRAEGCSRSQTHGCTHAGILADGKTRVAFTYRERPQS